MIRLITLMMIINWLIITGFSFCDTAGCLPRNLAQASDDLYSALLQWFTLFPEFQQNPFYPFGESYAGKFVPGIAKKIHDENPGATIKINLQGMGIGDGFMSPPDSSIYAEYLYALGLVDGVKLDELLMVEADMKRYAAQEDWVRCFETWSQEFDNFLRSMGCSYYYGVDLCVTPAEEDDYEWLVDDDRTRKAIHVGGKSFGAQSSEVYYAMQEDFMQSARPIIEFLLEHYKILMYNGNMDIICNHFGILKMFDAMTEWSGRDEFKLTTQLPYMVQGHTAGYLKVVHNLRLLVMRNAGHMVPRSQPEYSLQMFRQFISGLM